MRRFIFDDKLGNYIEVYEELRFLYDANGIKNVFSHIDDLEAFFKNDSTFDKTKIEPIFYIRKGTDTCCL